VGLDPEQPRLRAVESEADHHRLPRSRKKSGVSKIRFKSGVNRRLTTTACRRAAGWVIVRGDPEGWGG
jgi:hypothetical protein